MQPSPVLSLHSVPFSALQDLQGAVESYYLTVTSDHLSRVLPLPPESSGAVIGDLWPNTVYRVSLRASNGAHNTSEAAVDVTTEDGGTCVMGGGEGSFIFPSELLLPLRTLMPCACLRTLQLSLVPPGCFLRHYHHMSEAPLFSSNLSTIIKSALKTLENH